ncbi:hypothetical protein GTW20_06870 [Nocardiopsis alba]|uniref:Uncharacterized protein n=1 Tax=Nocardiopsis alba TaxID=53437 RepID=A0A7K2IPV4_9ACTN|nr:hypothetical protein [Nocardiopsis alba]
MNSRLVAPVPEALPDRVRAELTDVDRLREIWARRLQRNPLTERTAARRALTHDRVQEWGGGPELAELLLAAPAGAEPPLTGPYVATLAGRAAGLPPSPRTSGAPLTSEHTLALAEAAGITAHPVVRAAHAYAECVRLMNELDGSESEGEALHALPWALASRVLQRADHPPLLLDPRTPPPVFRKGEDPEEHFAALVAHFARLVIEALRREIGWNPGNLPVTGGRVPPLAVATRRRVMEHVRSRSAPVELLLRALDPAARAAVSSEDGEKDTDRDAVPPPRRPLTHGAAQWWTRMELATEGATLNLYVIVQEVGDPPSGVLAVTADTHLTMPDGTRRAWETSGGDSVTVLPSDSADDRWPRIRELVDEAISRAVDELTRV